MSGKFFVDTNILIYAHDISTGEKHQRARALIEGLWVSENGVQYPGIAGTLYQPLP
jgi:predicted nucleic acid-binding protein